MMSNPNKNPKSVLCLSIGFSDTILLSERTFWVILCPLHAISDRSLLAKLLSLLYVWSSTFLSCFNWLVLPTWPIESAIGPLSSLCPNHTLDWPDFIYHLDREGRTVHFHRVRHVTFHVVQFQIYPQILLGSGTTEWEA